MKAGSLALKLRVPRTGRTSSEGLEAWRRAIEAEGFVFREDEPYVALFVKDDLAPPIYLVKTNDHPQVVVEARYRDLAQSISDGRWDVDDEYFNSNMRRFDRKLNKGADREHFGTSISFETADQIREFLRQFRHALGLRAKRPV